MKKILIVVVVFIVLALGIQIGKQSTKPHTTATPPVVPSQSGQQSTQKEIILKDIAYATHERNTLNVLVPKGANAQTPFVLLIHGGAWYMGDKNDLALIQLALATKGIASASMNYRYASDTVAYDQLMRDVDTAVEFIVAQGTSWKIDTQNIAIGGASAGAHMALLYAYKYDTRDRISAVISLAGPTDLSSTELLDKVTTAKLIEGVNHMVGVDYVAGTSLDPVFNTVSPIGYVKNIPSLLVHGTKDSIVPYNQATQLVAVLKEKNIAHKLLTINGANHDLGVSNPNNIKKIIDAMAHWIKTYD